MQPCLWWAVLTWLLLQSIWCRLQTRSPSSSGASADGGDDDCSPKSHSTQLINIPEMQQQAAQIGAEQLQQLDRLDAAPAAFHVQQHIGDDDALDLLAAPQLLEQRSLADSALDLMVGASQQQLQQQLQLREGQLPSAGLNARPLGSDEYSGSGEQVHSGAEGEAGEEDPDRDLSVACQQAEENKLSFQLKFTEPEGECCWRAWACVCLAVMHTTCDLNFACTTMSHTSSRDLNCNFLRHKVQRVQ